MPNGRLHPIGGFYLKEHKKNNAKIKIRIKTVRSLIKKFITGTPEIKNRDLALSCSTVLLTHLVESYFLDTYRLKHFYGYYDKKERINYYKVAAYTVKWLLKVRPIILHEVGSGELNKKTAILINELFAFELACQIIKIKSDKIPINMKNRIIYNLHYKNFSESDFAILLENLSHFK